MSPPRLALVILAVRDLPAMVAFYRAVLGWPAVVEAPVYVELQHAGGVRLGLYVDRNFGVNLGAVPPPAPPLTRTELYLDCDDLPAAIDRALAAGARLLSPRARRDWGDDVAYLADPEGNVIALAGR